MEVIGLESYYEGLEYLLLRDTQWYYHCQEIPFLLYKKKNRRWKEDVKDVGEHQEENDEENGGGGDTQDDNEKENEE